METSEVGAGENRQGGLIRGRKRERREEEEEWKGEERRGRGSFI